MTYRRALIPALVGGLLLTVLLWWAGASTNALDLPGASSVFGAQSVGELRGWLGPWSYDPPTSAGFDRGTGGSGVGAGHYTDLHHTALQIRFAAVFAFFAAGTVLLVRRLPPVKGRMTAAFLALWAWGLVAGVVALTVSAPWWIAAQGHGSYRFLPNLASTAASGRPVLVVAALVAALGTVLVARVSVDDTAQVVRQAISARAARLAATVGTAVVAVSLLVLSYQPVAASIQTISGTSGLFAEPGDLLRQWLLLGAWSGPSGAELGDWLLYRAADVLLLVLVWWSLRRLPALLSRPTLPAMAVCAVCVVVLGLLVGQLLRMATDRYALAYGPLHLFAGLGGGVPAAVTFGLLAGAAAAVTLRVMTRRGDGTDEPATSAAGSVPSS
ncbi:hypothetical protein [Streptomyces sp. NPDC093568]|uniref:hypothetical protein n=1 Tax=Streptomyces sp. NPDC093568 TaxID=3366041 RepID=UPI0038149F69